MGRTNMRRSGTTRASFLLVSFVFGFACLTGGSFAYAQGQGGGSQVADPAPDRLWGGCALGQNETNAMISAVGDFDYLVLYSLQQNNGQQITGGFTGPIVCTARGVGIQSTSESIPIPGGNATVDVLASPQGQAVLYSPGPKKRICHQVKGIKRCHVVEAGSGGCVSGGTYDRIVRIIQREPTGTIVDSSVGFAFAVAYNIESDGLPAVCAAPGYKATQSTEVPPEKIPGPVTVRETEDFLALRYRIDPGGAYETRFCHSVGDLPTPNDGSERTDCFRIF